MNLNQPLFNIAVKNSQRRNRVVRADARHHHDSQRLLTEALWRWR
jgi:hypothetical protein